MALTGDCSRLNIFIGETKEIRECRNIDRTVVHKNGHAAEFGLANLRIDVTLVYHTPRCE